MNHLSLEYYKKQAQKLKKLFTSSSDYLSRVQAIDSGFSKSSLTLSKAQFIIAKEQGFESWPKLKKFIEIQNFKGVRFIIHGKLKTFLSKRFRKKPIDLAWEEHRTLKDWIESLRIPHIEVGRITVNSKKSALNNRLQDKDIVEVFEIDGPYDPRKVSQQHEILLPHIKFIADVHLGKLVRYLRILGLDCHYQEPWDDNKLAEKADKENRIMLSRDVGLLQRKCISHGKFLYSDDPIEQAKEILNRYEIYDLCKPMSRCVSCNSLMKTVAKQNIEHLIEPGTKQSYEQFFQCQSCSKVYWHGAHVKNILKTLKEIAEGVK